jgi:hypothetical protein
VPKREYASPDRRTKVRYIAHLWNGYEKREHPGGPVQGGGINSFQLPNEGQRWCMLSATWGDTLASPGRAVHLLQTALRDGEISADELKRNLYSILTVSNRFIPDCGLKASADQLHGK